MPLNPIVLFADRPWQQASSLSLGVLTLVIAPSLIRPKAAGANFPATPTIAQALPQAPGQEPLSLPPLDEEPEAAPVPRPTRVPAPGELLETPTGPGILSTPEGEGIPGTIVVTAFEFVGNTAFSDAELAEVVVDYVDTPISFNQLLEARSAITQAYVAAGYTNSGAFVPADQRIVDGVVQIQVVEGRLEAITIEGLYRLNPDYLRRRIQVRTGQPLNVEELVEALQLLQVDPLIEQISAELQAGNTTGGSVLALRVAEADAVTGLLTLDNARSPLVGSFRQRLAVDHINLTGQGDRISLGYSNTIGSESIDLRYAYPLNPYNGTLEFRYGRSRSEIVEPAFAALNIVSNSQDIEVGIRQPIYQTPTEELALGLGLSYDESASSFQLGDFPREPFPTEGADANGEARVTALRFSQEWVRRGATRVMALRSQFSLGLDWFNATQSTGDVPDSDFFSWQGQAQYVRIFDNDALMLLRFNGQLSSRPLLSSEQFRLGGQGSVRGYRQDFVTADSGLFASAEVRFPLLSIPESATTMQLAPFVDYGLGWNRNGGTAGDLLSVGAGLIWQFGERVNARLDYGIPLIDPGTEGNSWQEDGILFTLTAEVF